MIGAFKKIVEHFVRWNNWRKHSLNTPLHKLLVLLGLVYSPTFAMYDVLEIFGDSFFNGVKDGCTAKDFSQEIANAIGKIDEEERRRFNEILEKQIHNGSDK